MTLFTFTSKPTVITFIIFNIATKNIDRNKTADCGCRENMQS